jgi:Ion channel
MKGYQEYDNLSLYLTAFYFTVTTIVTVGYGDITPYNNAERCFVIFLMLVGVISFSFATGTLSSIIQSHDSKNAALKE